MADSCAAVIFCFFLGETGTEIFEKLKMAYEDDAIGKKSLKQVSEGFSRFRRDEMLIDDKSSSCDSFSAQIDENVENIREIIMKDRRRTIEKVGE